MSIRFNIKDWAAYAPGLHDHAAWLAWAKAAYLPVGDDVPVLSEMPAMQRRRLERVGRFALQVAYWCQTAQAADIPLVFASRHGDIQRTYAMLDALARKEALSPTHFGLSIHNAIVAQYSIARQFKHNYLAVAAGKSTAEAAIIEATGLLHDGAEEVLVVMYDGSLPEAYQEFRDESFTEYAWAWRLQNANKAGVSFSLETLKITEENCGNTSPLPHGLELMRFMLSNEPSLLFDDGERHWRWQRHV
jgi:Beta-ketoacyl synthase, N-terminal domain